MGRGRITHKIGSVLVTNYPEETKLLIRQLEFARNDRNVDLEISKLKRLLELFNETSDWAKTGMYALQLLQIAEKIQDTTIEKLALEYLTMAHYNVEDYNKAINFGSRWINLAEKFKKGPKGMQDLVDAYMNVAASFLKRFETEGKKSDYANAKRLLSDSFGILNQTSMSPDDIERAKADLYLNLGLLEKSANNIDKAIELIEETIALASTLQNLAYCYDACGKYGEALSFGRQSQKLMVETRNKQGELAVIGDNAGRCEKLQHFDAALEHWEAYRKLANELADTTAVELGNQQISNARQSIANYKKVQSLSAFILDAKAQGDLRKQMRLLSERGKLRLELGMGKEAREDFQGQKGIADTINLNSEMLAKINIDIGKAFLVENNGLEAEKFIKHGLKAVGNNYEDNIEYRWNLYEALTINGYGTRSKSIEMVLEEISRIAEDEQDYAEQLKAIEALENLHNHFNQRDCLKVDKARIKRLKERLPYNSDESDPEEIIPERISPQKRPIQVEESDADSISEIEISQEKPVTKKVRKVIKTLDSDDDMPVEVDYTRSHSQVSSIDLSPKKEVDKTRRNVIQSSPSTVSDIIVPSSVKPFRISESSSAQQPIHLSDDEVSDKMNGFPSFGGFEFANSQEYFGEEILSRSDSNQARAEIIVSETTSNRSISSGLSGDIIPPTPDISPSFVDRERPLSSIDINKDMNKIKDISKDMENDTATFNLLKSVSTPSLNRVEASLAENELEDRETTPKARSLQNSLPKPVNFPSPKAEQKTFRIKVEYTTPAKKKSVFTIPCVDGPFGTPKSVRWLIDETQKRFHERHKENIEIDEILYEDEPLCQRDPLKHILEHNDIVQFSTK